MATLEERIVNDVPKAQVLYQAKGVEVVGRLKREAGWLPKEGIRVSSGTINASHVSCGLGDAALAFSALDALKARRVDLYLEWSGRKFGPGKLSVGRWKGKPYELMIRKWDGDELCRHFSDSGVVSEVLEPPVDDEGYSSRWRRKWNSDANRIAMDLESMLEVLLSSTKVRLAWEVRFEGALSDCWLWLNAHGLMKPKQSLDVAFQVRLDDLSDLVELLTDGIDGAVLGNPPWLWSGEVSGEPFAASAVLAKDRKFYLRIACNKGASSAIGSFLDVEFP